VVSGTEAANSSFLASAACNRDCKVCVEWKKKKEVYTSAAQE